MAVTTSLTQAALTSSSLASYLGLPQPEEPPLTSLAFMPDTWDTLLQLAPRSATSDSSDYVWTPDCTLGTVRLLGSLPWPVSLI